MATHCSTLAWKIPWTMDGGAWWAAVHGVAKCRTRLSDFTFTFHFHALEKEMAIYSSVLAWKIPGMGEPGGLPSMESHRVGHDWSDLAAAEWVQLCSSLSILWHCLSLGFSIFSISPLIKYTQLWYRCAVSNELFRPFWFISKLSTYLRGKTSGNDGPNHSRNSGKGICDAQENTSIPAETFS